MKKKLLTGLLVLMSIAIEAQTVAVVDFMKVPGNNQDVYLAVEKQWKNLHQSRVESGVILGWQLYYVRNSGTNSPYNYATVAIYENFAKTETPLTDDDFKKAFGNNSAEFLKKTEASRNLIYAESYRLEVGIPSDIPDKYLIVNMVHTDDLGRYINMEKVGFMPIHEQAIKEGKKNSWGIWSRWPYEDNSFQAVTVDGYAKFTDINSEDYNDLMGKATVGKKPGEVYDMMEQMSKTGEIRTFIRSEIWDLVDATTPKK